MTTPHILELVIDLRDDSDRLAQVDIPDWLDNNNPTNREILDVLSKLNETAENLCRIVDVIHMKDQVK